MPWSEDIEAEEVQTREREPARAPDPPATKERTASPVESLASQLGNQAFGQVVGRMQGDGILEGGAVHPGVEQAISSSRGSGASLDRGVQEKFAPQLGDSLSDVKIHADSTADA